MFELVEDLRPLVVNLSKYSNYGTLPRKVDGPQRTPLIF